MTAVADLASLKVLCDRLRALLVSRSGNVAVIFALALLPLCGFVGMTVDYSRANSTRAAMQAALDATALALAKDMSTGGPQVQQFAQDYFAAVFNRRDAENIQITASFEGSEGGTLVVSASGRIKTEFMGIMGFDSLAIGATSTTTWGNTKLQIALALDNTGSMSSSGKMTALKQAAHSLLDTLKKAAKTPDAIKVAIIPFDTTVNLGTAYKNENWFDWSSIVCLVGKKLGACSGNSAKNFWEGCVEDRTPPYDVLNTVPSLLNVGTLFPGTECGSLATLIPLTSDWTALKSKVDKMEPNGYTNVTIGLVWAWHALTENILAKGAVSSPTSLEKYIILLTDGENTQNRWTKNPVEIDTRTKLACDNIKAADIKLFTIRVIEGNATLLSGCATNPTMHFDVKEAGQLNAIFQGIADHLALRLAK